MIDMNKKYKTRSGLPARVLCVDRAEFNPVVYLLMDDGGESIVSTTIDGRYAFLGEENGLDLIETTPYEDFKIDDPAMVRDFGGPWFCRHFAGVDEKGRAKTWSKGRTSWTSDGEYDYSSWNECRRPTPEELADVKV